MGESFFFLALNEVNFISLAYDRTQDFNELHRLRNFIITVILLSKIVEERGFKLLEDFSLKILFDWFLKIIRGKEYWIR